MTGGRKGLGSTARADRAEGVGCAGGELEVEGEVKEELKRACEGGRLCNKDNGLEAATEESLWIKSNGSVTCDAVGLVSWACNKIGGEVREMRWENLENENVGIILEW